ncbi:hypothetical protein Tco_0294750 [Tanacetum coccineum]
MGNIYWEKGQALECVGVRSVCGAGVVNKDRSIEYLQELVQRDGEMVQRLQALEREVGERTDEKLLFIEKLKGNVPF